MPILRRYAHANRRANEADKNIILNEYRVCVCGHHRKYALRLLGMLHS